MRGKKREIYTVAHPSRAKWIWMTEPDFQRRHNCEAFLSATAEKCATNEMMFIERKATDSRKFFMRYVVRIGLGFVAAAVVAALIHAQKYSTRIPDGTVIDRIVVEKSTRKLSILKNGHLLKTYQVALGANPIGRKEQEGDMKTPEGLYTIDRRNSNSDYHLSLHISYPAAEDVKRAEARGVSAGCDIMIHGLPNGQGWMGNLHNEVDWTAGCIALTDEEIEELWRITPDGTPIEIKP